MQVSQLRFYSLAIVARNKALNSKMIEATPIEDHPMVDGEISDNATKYNSSGVDESGSAFQIEGNATVSVPAEYTALGGSSNRMTAPDVRRGETIVLFKFGDTDKFYWSTMDNTLRFRKLETVIFGISGTRDENAEPSLENTYTFEMSTHNKRLKIHTTQADGEPFMYDITLDTGNGFFEIKDNIDNVIRLDSAERQILFKNTDGSFLDINKAIITQHSDSEWNVTTAKATMTFDTLEISATTTHNGDITHNGNMNRQGNMSTAGNLAVTGGGTTTLSGTMNGQADINLQGTIRAGQVISEQDVVAPNV